MWNPLNETFESVAPAVRVEREMPKSRKGAIKGAGEERRVTAAVLKSLTQGKMPTKRSVKTQIAEKCGVSVKKVGAVTDRLVGLTKVMRSAGIDEELIVEKLKEGLSSEKVHLASYEGEFVDERRTADMGERRAYLDMVLRLRGDYPKEEVAVDITQRIIRLPAKKEIGYGAKVIDVEFGESLEIGEGGEEADECFPDSAPVIS